MSFTSLYGYIVVEYDTPYKLNQTETKTCLGFYQGAVLCDRTWSEHFIDFISMRKLIPELLTANMFGDTLTITASRYTCLKPRLSSVRESVSVREKVCTPGHTTYFKELVFS